MSVVDDAQDPPTAPQPIGGDRSAHLDQPPQPAALVLPSQRVESADELLDLDSRPTNREPLFRFPSLPGSRRVQRLVRMALTVAAVAAVAGAAGVATHTADLHRAADQQRDRTLIRLVGGGVTLSLPGSPSTGSGPVRALMDISVRNDGALPQTIDSLTLDAPGVAIVTAPARTTVQPGHATAIGLRVTVDCDRKDLPERPKSVTLQVRSGSAGVEAEEGVSEGKNAASKAAAVTLPFSGSSFSAIALLHGFAGTGSFYEICGYSQVTDNGPVTSYVGPAVRATRAKPSFSFQITVRNDSERGGVLATEKPAMGYPGLTVSGDLPAAAMPLASGSSVPATVTVQMTDCDALGTAVSAEEGVRNLVDVVSTNLPLASEPADPRFRGHMTSRPLSITGNVSAFEQDLLTNLVAACPGLK